MKDGRLISVDYVTVQTWVSPEGNYTKKLLLRHFTAYQNALFSLYLDATAVVSPDSVPGTIEHVWCSAQLMKRQIIEQVGAVNPLGECGIL